MKARFCSVLILLLLPLPTHALEARVETLGGVPALMVNGKPMPPSVLFHAAGANVGLSLL